MQDIEAFPACRTSDRKLRLFACACYRRIRHLLPDRRAEAAVEVAERVADGLMPVEVLPEAEASIRVPIDNLEGRWRASRGVEHIALLPTHEALALSLITLWPQAPKAAYYASSNAYLTAAAIANPGASSSDKKYSASRVLEVTATEPSWWPDPEVTGRAIRSAKPETWTAGQRDALNDYLEAVTPEAPAVGGLSGVRFTARHIPPPARYLLDELFAGGSCPWAGASVGQFTAGA